MASKATPLDELVWQSNDAAANVGQGWGVHNNNVLYYFAESPFFDRTSNNQIVRTQAEMPGRVWMIETREAFENELRKRSGLEFMVAHSHTDYGHADFANSMGRWVIHKQRRTKRAPGADEVEVLATYFVLGDLVYMAPSVGNIIWNRVNAMTDQLNSFISTASELPTFTPAAGYQYADSSAKRGDQSRASAGPSTTTSRAGSPAPDSASQDDLVMGNSQDSAADSVKSTGSNGLSATDAQALVESFRTFQQYRHEYMDEVPLLGEPGSFSFANRPSAPRPSARATPATSKTSTEAATQSQAQISTQDSAKSEASKGAKTEDKPVPPKIRRRKSKHANSPTTPTGHSNPTSPLSAAPSPAG